MSIPTFKLLDGSKIPWLAWGNGTGDAKQNPVEMGKLALDAGINHIDTAQGYNNEPETSITLKSTHVKRSEIWLTSKRECELTIN
jgi:diketogulonate reductase-like aldo/keto reductase